MKHLKSFENFDLGRFSEDEDHSKEVEEVEEVEDDDCTTCGEDNDDLDELGELDELEEEEQEEEDTINRRKVWGDELIERAITKKRNLSIQKTYKSNKK